jgi:tRNA G10  N-methylase Trm11
MSAQPFLFHFAQVHADFRHAELHSVAALHGFALDLSAHDASRPFAVLSLPEVHARALAARCVLVK